MHENWTHCEKKANVRSCSPIVIIGVSVKISRNLVGREKICASRPNSLLRPWSLFFQKSTRLKDCPWFLIRIGILCFGSVNYCSFPVLVIALWTVLYCVFYAHNSLNWYYNIQGLPLPLFVQEYLLPTSVHWSVDCIWLPRLADTFLSLQFFFVVKIDYLIKPLRKNLVERLYSY